MLLILLSESYCSIPSLVLFMQTLIDGVGIYLCSSTCYYLRFLIVKRNMASFSMQSQMHGWF